MWKKTDEVIDRWNRKTTLSQGIMQKELKAINRTVLNQISQLLSDRQRLVKRTQMKRSSAKTFGAALYKKVTSVIPRIAVTVLNNLDSRKYQSPMACLKREKRRRKKNMTKKSLMIRTFTTNCFAVPSRVA